VILSVRHLSPRSSRGQVSSSLVRRGSVVQPGDEVTGTGQSSTRPFPVAVMDVSSVRSLTPSVLTHYPIYLVPSKYSLSLEHQVVLTPASTTSRLRMWVDGSEVGHSGSRGHCRNPDHDGPSVLISSNTSWDDRYLDGLSEGAGSSLSTSDTTTSPSTPSPRSVSRSRTLRGSVGIKPRNTCFRWS
jgi:hypothetical protein